MRIDRPTAGLLIGAIAVAFGSYLLGYQHGEQAVSPAPAMQIADSDKSRTQIRYVAADDASAIAADADHGQASLVAQLASLQQQYQSLRDKTERDRLSREQRQQLPDLLKQTLDQLPFDIISSRVEYYTGISGDTLAQMPDQRAFVDRLTDIALEGIVTEAEEEPEPLFGPVRFTDRYKNGEVKQWFSSMEVTVFANFDTYAYADSSVFVKWYRVDDGEVMLFKEMPVRTADTNHVWLNLETGFAPGQYRVDIYDLSQEMNLLSNGNYNVVAY